MSTIKFYPNGITAGNPPGKPNLKPVRRGDTIGWSDKVSRNLTNWLFSVESSLLSGFGIAFTLTIRECPYSPQEWTDTRNRFLQIITRLGAIRIQWLTEWQRRRVPHLHGCIFFPDDMACEASSLVAMCEYHWMKVSAKFRPTHRAQHVRLMDPQMVGWFKYLSKHASRSKHNYQRSMDKIPHHWHKTGRMWGYRGDWPLCEPVDIETTLAAFHRFRRLCRGWRKADARSQLQSITSRQLMIAADKGKTSPVRVAARRISSARSMLKCRDRALSAVRGVSEWIPDFNRDSIIRWLETP